MQGFVALPTDVQLALTAVIVSAVVFAVQFAIGRFPWLSFFSAYAREWGLAIAALLIEYIQNALPTGYDDVSVKLILFVLALIGVFVKFAAARNVKGFTVTE